MNGNDRRSALATLGVLTLSVLCCGLPALAAAGGLAAVGGWLAAHGSWLAAGALLAVAAGLTGRWWVGRRRRRLPVTRPARFEGR